LQEAILQQLFASPFGQVPVTELAQHDNVRLAVAAIHESSDRSRSLASIFLAGIYALEYVTIADGYVKLQG